MSESKAKILFDPRMGDEEPDEDVPQPSPQRTTRKRVHMDRHPTFEEAAPRRYPASPCISDSTVRDSKSEGRDEEEKPPKLTFLQWVLKNSPIDLNWIPANWSWSKIKPVIRCAVTGWVSVLFFIIPQLEVMLGQVRILLCYLRESVTVIPCCCVDLQIVSR